MKIVTDSAADMSREELRELGVVEIVQKIRFPEGEVDPAELGYDAFYARLEKDFPKIPFTSLPSVGYMANTFREIAQNDRDILAIMVSSGLSGTQGAMHLAIKDVDGAANVTLFDSLTLSVGERFQVFAAVWAVQRGWPLEKILKRLEQIRAQTETIYTLEKLDYLSHGGRIGRVTALAGSLLKIKPVIEVAHVDGKYSTAGRARTIPNALNMICENLFKLYDSRLVWVSLTHGQYFEPAEVLSGMLKNKLNVARFELKRVTPVLGVHTGPGIVGASVVPMGLFDDLIS
jgi:DegV family protein with EDD domain